MKTIRTGTLEIAYEESGPAAGRPVILLHGFPDDVHAYDGVAPTLAARGWRVFVPYLRGYGPTRFLDAGTPRSGLVSRAWPVQTAMRNCTRDEGGPFEVGNQVLTSSHRKLLSSKAMVVNVAETSGHDPGRHD